MEKVKIFMKKNETIFVFLMFIILFMIPSFGIKLLLLDDLWNFTNVYKMLNGYKIYQECNVIITPLFFYIGEIVLKIFRANFFWFNVYNMLINAFLYSSIYVLIKCFNISKLKSLLYTLIIVIISNNMLCWGANYNNLAIAFSVLGITLLLKNKSYWWQGIIIFLVFMTKQNIGVYYAIGLTLGRLWINKNNFKITIKETVANALTSISLIMIYVVYLYFNGCLYDFIDLNLLGISEFAGKNLYISTRNIGLIVLQAVIAVFSGIVIINKKVQLPNKLKVDLKTLFCILIMFLFIEYPILNFAHMIMASLLALVMLFVILENIIIKDFLNNKKIIIISAIISALILIGIECYIVYPYLNDKYETDTSSPYFGIKVDEQTRSSMKTVCNYIADNKEKNKKTIILSYKADLYFNIFKLNNNKLDLPFLGNLGSKGEDGIIDELNELKDTYILISKGKLTIQESEKAVNYVKNNFNLIGEIDEFYIYESHDM